MDNNIQYRISLNPNDPDVKVSKIKNNRYRIEFTEDNGKVITYDAKATYDPVYHTLYFPIPKGNGKATLKKLRDHGIGEFVKFDDTLTIVTDKPVTPENINETIKQTENQTMSINTQQNNQAPVVPANVPVADTQPTTPTPTPEEAAMQAMYTALAAKGVKVPLDPNKLTINNYGYNEVPKGFNNVNEAAMFLLTAEGILMNDDKTFAAMTGITDGNTTTIALRRQGINMAWQQLAHPDIEGVGQPGHPNYRLLDGTCTKRGKPMTTADLDHHVNVTAPAIQAKQEQDMKDALAELRQHTGGASNASEDWTDTAMRYGRYALTAAAIAGTGYLIYKGVNYLMGDDSPEA